jgi:hypothetical protein
MLGSVSDDELSANIWDYSDPAWIHEQLGNNPNAWLTWVYTLTEASKRLRPKPDASRTLPDGQELMLMTDAVYAMLLGYAFECGLKGLWVQKGNRIVADGRLQRIANVGDHELLQLANAVGIAEIEPTMEELDALNRLTPFIRFAGRYPIPITPEEMKPRAVAGQGKIAPGFYSLADFAVAERLLNRMTTRLRRALAR